MGALPLPCKVYHQYSWPSISEKKYSGYVYADCGSAVYDIGLSKWHIYESAIMSGILNGQGYVTWALIAINHH